jgi:branched-chain amino acid transport system ATP-binding protein
MSAQLPMLCVRNLVVDIQESRILRAVSLDVGRGELVCLVGRNGAGKTTTFRTIMALLRPVSGDILFQGKSLLGWRTPQVARAGIGYAPEESGIFGDLSVEENIALPTWTRTTARSAAERIALAYQVFPKLEGYRKRGGQQLSGGERKMVSIARALALDPDLLLLDEPFEGLSPAIIPTVAQGIASIRASGRSVLLAESNFHHLPEDADRLVVLERGEIVFDGLPADALRDPAVARVTGVTAAPP